jgi:hypothetical protein
LLAKAVRRMSGGITRINGSQLTGIQGARIWCGHGVLAHNLVKVGTLAQ